MIHVSGAVFYAIELDTNTVTNQKIQRTLILFFLNTLYSGIFNENVNSHYIFHEQISIMELLKQYKFIFSSEFLQDL